MIRLRRFAVSESGFAIHLATGDVDGGTRIDHWLAQRKLHIRRFDDPYSTAVELLQNRDSEPAVICIGTDWLVGSEYCLVEFVRQLWPGAPIVLYGEYADEIEPSNSNRILRLQCVEAFEKLLREPPPELELAMQRTIVRRDERSSDGSTVQESPGNGSANKQPANPVNRPTLIGRDELRDDDANAGLRASRDALSPQELATLLGEHEPRNS